jgi:predicted nucleic acid-binding protein
MPRRQTVALQPLLAWADEYSSSDYSDALARNTARTCVRNFLTQRAIQSFTFLLEDCRDPHTVRWLEVSGAHEVYCQVSMDRKQLNSNSHKLNVFLFFLLYSKTLTFRI